jgi:hypothetical protein
LRSASFVALSRALFHDFKNKPINMRKLWAETRDGTQVHAPACVQAQALAHPRVHTNTRAWQRSVHRGLVAAQARTCARGAHLG